MSFTVFYDVAVRTGRASCWAEGEVAEAFRMEVSWTSRLMFTEVVRIWSAAHCLPATRRGRHGKSFFGGFPTVSRRIFPLAGFTALSLCCLFDAFWKTWKFMAMEKVGWVGSSSADVQCPPSSEVKGLQYDAWIIAVAISVCGL